MVGDLYPNRGHIAAHLATQRMLVTALGRRIGYDRAVKIGKPALAENTILKQAAERQDYARREDLDRCLVPATMTRPGARLPGGGD
jgi:fumarate hydratase, class II